MTIVRIGPPPPLKTIKEIGITEVLMDAVENNVDIMCIINGYNYKYSLEQEINRHNLQNKILLINLVNKYTKQPNEILIPKGRILATQKETEFFVQQRVNPSKKIKDYTDFIPKTLLSTADYLIGKNVDWISLPVGSGKTFCVLARAIEKKKSNTKLIGFAPAGENGIYNGLNVYKLHNSLNYRDYNPTSITKELSCPYTRFKPEIKKFLKQGHFIIEQSNKELEKSFETALRQGVNICPSAAAGYSILNLQNVKKTGINPDSTNGVILVTRSYKN